METTAPVPQTISDDERFRAALCHWSIGGSVLVGPLVVALPAWFWYEERMRAARGEKSSPFVTFHAAQACCYQAAVFAALAVLSTVAFLLTVILIGLLLIPVILLLAAAALIYGVMMGVWVNQGKDERYYVVGAMVQERFFTKAP